LRPHQVQPERQLMVAVLEDAVWCFRKYRSATQPWQKRLFRETCEWLAAEPNDNLFSFSSICEVLGIDPVSVRCTLWTRPLRGETHAPRRRLPHTVGQAHRAGDGGKE